MPPESEWLRGDGSLKDLFISASPEFRFADSAEAVDGAPKLPTFGIVGYTGVPMRPSGFINQVIVDLQGTTAAAQTIPVLFSHDPGRIVGQTSAVEIGDQITMEGTITGENADAKEVVSQAKNGFQWQASIGASINRYEFLKPGKTATVNGREVTGPMIIARESVVKEISFVAIGADNNTSARIAASSVGSSKENDMNFAEFVKAKGFEPEALSDAQRGFFESLFASEQAEQKQKKTTQTLTAASLGTAASVANTDGASSTRTLDQIASEAREERDRKNAITAEADIWIQRRPTMIDEIQAMAKAAIDGKNPLVEFRLAMHEMRAEAPSAPAIHARTNRLGPDMVEAAVCRAGGLSNLEDHFKERTLDESDRRFPRGIGLRQLLMISANENGSHIIDDSDIRGMLRASFRPEIKAEGFSTLSLPGILSNVANKFLVTGFNAVESSWRQITSIRSVRDFKATTSYSLTGGMVYEKIGAGGEIQHATVGELSYSNQADTYGRMFAITRKHIINDDLGALTEIPMKLGRGAALKLNDVFWTEFLDNSSFFTTGHANLASGASSALSSDGLKAAQLKFRKMTDADGLPTGILPRVLLVPSELEITADELMTSYVVNTGGSSTTDKVPNRNVWSNKYQVVTSTYLSNASYTGYSTTGWYLIADPAALPVVETAFLNGRQEPVVETAEADFDVLGIQLRGYYDFGVAKQEYRAGVKFAGA